MSNLISVTAANFDEVVVNSKTPVVVDFWAEWCGPCKAFAPIIEKTASAMPNVKFVKINVDEAPDISQKFNIMSIPTLVFFENGTPRETAVGSMKQADLEAKIKSIFKL